MFCHMQKRQAVTFVLFEPGELRNKIILILSHMILFVIFVFALD